MALSPCARHLCPLFPFHLSISSAPAARHRVVVAAVAFMATAGAALGVPRAANAGTTTAASCSQSAAQGAIDRANAGDTVLVPAGSCSWGGINLAKAIHLRGAGIDATRISLGSGNKISKRPEGVTRISGFTFTKSGGGNSSKGFDVTGSWKNAQPLVIEGNKFSIRNSGLLRIGVVGGVIVAKNSFSGGWDDSFIQVKDANDLERSWRTADTLGTRDSSGKLNNYIEGNTFYGGTNQGIDCDDATRCVYRYNVSTYSSFNSHGYDTGPKGMRHFEVYGNRFVHPGGTSQLAAQNWSVWIRGATGVIFNNDFDDIAGPYWGNKAELKFSIRGAEDARPQGSCSNVKYPVPHQIGQNYNGSSYFRDPIYIWGNSGTIASSAGWNWGNPCGLNFATFFQWGRDAVNGTVKPGYAPYHYPHPLRQSYREPKGRHFLPVAPSVIGKRPAKKGLAT